MELVLPGAIVVTWLTGLFFLLQSQTRLRAILIQLVASLLVGGVACVCIYLTMSRATDSVPYDMIIWLWDVGVMVGAVNVIFPVLQLFRPPKKA